MYFEYYKHFLLYTNQKKRNVFHTFSMYSERDNYTIPGLMAGIGLLNSDKWQYKIIRYSYVSIQNSINIIYRSTDCLLVKLLMTRIKTYCYICWQFYDCICVSAGLITSSAIFKGGKSETRSVYKNGKQICTSNTSCSTHWSTCGSVIIVVAGVG